MAAEILWHFPVAEIAADSTTRPEEGCALFHLLHFCYKCVLVLKVQENILILNRNED
jgi:hypothetical protein